MNRILLSSIILMACLAVWAGGALGAEFCVSNETELHGALDGAASNWGDDVIKVQQGTYMGNFMYTSSNWRSITLLGGYTPGCTTRVIDPANTILDGGGIYSVLKLWNWNGGDITVEGFTVQNGNAIGGQGGGIIAISQSDSGTAGNVILAKNIITGNSAAYAGGGIFVKSWSDSGNASNVTLTDNVIMGNTANDEGGGVLATSESQSGAAGEVTLTNNIITGNSGGWFGGILALSGYDSSGIVTVTNNTISGNTASEYVGGIGLWMYDNTNYVYNNIIWGNTASFGADIYLGGSGTANGYNNDYSDMAGSWTNSGNNIDDDPDFVGSGDYHLIGDSPCIDAGDNNAPNIPAADFDGYPRIWDGDDDGTFVVDMGAYEYRTGVIDEIMLLTPNGGEVLPSGLTCTVQWYAPSDQVSFKLKYSLDNGNTWQLLARDVTGNSYDWPVPVPKKNKKKCLVKVIGYDDSDTKVGADKSDSTFAIEVVKVTSPKGGETLTSGNICPIQWDTHVTKRYVATVKLLYTKNGGKTWNNINTLDGNPGSYNEWTVPPVPKTKRRCRVKVVLKDENGKKVGSDPSDGHFTIEPSL